MTDQLSAPPVLSTPDTHIFEGPQPLVLKQAARLSDEELHHVYEISRTAGEIRQGGWRRIALQFPDTMLHDAPRVFEAIQYSLADQPGSTESIKTKPIDVVSKELRGADITKTRPTTEAATRRRLFILADTSYGACCVDEVAAEHVDADVVVHYGRSCLSPTARLPVIYVFTSRSLALDPLISSFEETFPAKDTKIVLMSDIIYSNHIPKIFGKLKSLGYTNVFAPSVIHDPSSLIPNRTIPQSIKAGEEEFKEYSLFHISDPPTSLLLTLSSRLQSMYIYPTAGELSAMPKALRLKPRNSFDADMHS